MPRPEPRRIDATTELVPELRYIADELVRRAEDELGIRIKIIETYRDDDRQLWLYEKGRTEPGRIVTRTKPGRSWHQHRRAFDFVVLDEHGRADWNNTAAYTSVGHFAEELGLEWGGRFEGLADLGHLQLTRMSIADAIDLELARGVVDLVHQYLARQEPVDRLGGES